MIAVGYCRRYYHLHTPRACVYVDFINDPCVVTQTRAQVVSITLSPHSPVRFFFFFLPSCVSRNVPITPFRVPVRLLSFKFLGAVRAGPINKSRVRRRRIARRSPRINRGNPFATVSEINPYESNVSEQTVWAYPSTAGTRAPLFLSLVPCASDGADIAFYLQLEVDILTINLGAPPNGGSRPGDSGVFVRNTFLGTGENA